MRDVKFYISWKKLQAVWKQMKWIYTSLLSADWQGDKQLSDQQVDSLFTKESNEKSGTIDEIDNTNTERPISYFYEAIGME